MYALQVLHGVTVLISSDSITEDMNTEVEAVLMDMLGNVQGIRCRFFTKEIIHTKNTYA